MNLLGQEITHNKFGTGTVVDSTDRMITVCFKMGNKRFVYPDAFEQFLVLHSAKEQQQMDEVVNGIIQEREEQAEQLTLRKECDERIRRLKVDPNSQVAFSMRVNRKEDVFATWSISTGAFQSGKSIGKARVPKRMHFNSACLLTECQKGEPEKSRRIIGAFMTKERFSGARCKSGIVRSHELYRIQLTEQEQMLYWDYFQTDDKAARWGGVEFKYFSNTIMQQILSDMKERIHDQERHALMEQFYQYFTEVNKLEE